MVLCEFAGRKKSHSNPVALTHDMKNDKTEMSFTKKYARTQAKNSTSLRNYSPCQRQAWLANVVLRHFCTKGLPSCSIHCQLAQQMDYLFEDVALRECVPVDALVAGGTLPEPAVLAVLHSIQEVLADLK